MEPDRGKFWGDYLKFANQVITLLAPIDSNVETAVAFYFKETVVVEFAPMGNAVYVYDTAVFNKELKLRRSWKNLPLARERWSHLPGWQYTFTRNLQKILGGGLL